MNEQQLIAYLITIIGEQTVTIHDTRRRLAELSAQLDAFKNAANEAALDKTPE